MRRLLLTLAVLGMLMAETQAQNPRTPFSNGAPQKGPDLSKINQSAGRILDRPGSGGFVPFGYFPIVPYPPIYYAPVFIEVPVPYFDPFYPVPPWAYVPPPAPPPARPAPPQANNQAPKPAPPLRERDELEQRAEMQKHLRAGNDAFASADYGVALRRYEQAVAAAPLEPTGYFHLAQAQVAIGKHPQAVVSIQRGLRLHPRWPEAGFQPRALYRDRAGNYDQHLALLADQVGKNLNDDLLMFLLAYQLWFDGKRDEATTLFARAASLAFDPTFIDRFLKLPKAVAP